MATGSPRNDPNGNKGGSGGAVDEATLPFREHRLRLLDALLNQGDETLLGLRVLLEHLDGERLLRRGGLHRDDAMGKGDGVAHAGDAIGHPLPNPERPSGRDDRFHQTRHPDAGARRFAVAGAASRRPLSIVSGSGRSAGA
ncbi:hypothetical protein BOSEA31B_12174 [Hyphomicrobiales bacterium]|nr:hypothetical protein BOSEA31B_12174 [Hyphomicrobiales bacterium]CAH1697954.1 hypothetical protein BOSEA1005_10999 [Hyphomicrobiales bacterium]CAI0347601.1 hypothetical protein BO1005MUT1_70382 [Hyphomicrobiales bacterium]